VRSTIQIVGARVHNLKNISLEIPRDQLIIVTGVSGSGKSSLAFDTVYAEGQRRYMESLSSYAKRFVEQVARPDVDFVYGLSPVISIEQKTIARSPRSTVGTLTDIASYLNLLFATVGEARCPRCQAVAPIRTVRQIAERLLALPEGTTVELHAPIFPYYGEDLDFLFTDVRKKGVRCVTVDGVITDLSALAPKAADASDTADEQPSAPETLSADAAYDAVVDRIVVRRQAEKSLLAAIENAVQIGERFLRVFVVAPDGALTPLEGLGCPEHGYTLAAPGSADFMFNNPTAACRTCIGIGTYRQVHPRLLVPDTRRSIAAGCFVPEAFRYSRDTWDGALMFSLAQRLGFGLDTPFADLPVEVVRVLYYGLPERITLQAPPGGKFPAKYVGRETRWDGLVRRIERQYRRYRESQTAHSNMEEYLQKVMVENRCPDCQGARLRAQRLLVTVADRNLHEIGELNFADLRLFLDGVAAWISRNRDAGSQILSEISSRVDLLLGIGLDYLNFNRNSGTLSGGEAQRIRLSTQIGSGLMGMLYVLDEPSIGLHPKDNEKMIGTLRRLRDLGNTVLVVEHDEDTIRAADHVIEIGPLAGVHGGKVVAQGQLADIAACPDSLTGQYLSGTRRIVRPDQRRPGNGKRLTVRGARENNLRNVTVSIPLGTITCVTGASGSGKSTLINDILYRELYSRFVDTRTLSGAHDAIEGVEYLRAVIDIDQSPIGRTSRSNPATYIGFFDAIRDLFAATEESVARGYTASRFSFNVKGGRCEECGGNGNVTTQLGFMPDVESVCESCKGQRFNSETLDIQYQGKDIAEVLELSIEEGVAFFADQPAIGRKLRLLDELGLGYLTLGQSSTTLSGGEAQRIKLANELSKIKRGGDILYILDEPTTGLHLHDIDRLLHCIARLADAGHTVVIIEHHLDVIHCADHVIDLGPEGGHRGGEIVATGTPEDIMACPASHTGRFLRQHLTARGRPS
jgi:excinuclease ABC subunit A